MSLTATASVWDTVETGGDGGFAENIDPPLGFHTVTISDAKSGTSKKGEEYIIIEYTLDGAGTWIDYKQTTKGGSPFPGGIKSAKILLQSLGLPNVDAATLDASLAMLIGKQYSVEVVNADKINNTTGVPYKNTKVHSAVAVQAKPAEAIAPVAAPAADDVIPF